MRPARRARKEISYTYETCDDATDEDDIVPYNPKGYQPPEASMEQPVMLARIKEEQPSIPDSEAYQESDSTTDNSHYDHTKKGFMSLPPEIRLNIYKRVLIKEKCVDFGARRGFAHSSALLCANKIMAAEGAAVLYSMNKFVLRPCRDRQGRYWEEDWDWIGYKAVRDFLETIGPSNIGLLKIIGLEFHDAAPTDEPKASAEQRRFQFNIDLFRCLQLLSEHATSLEYIKLYFSGRAKFRHRDNKDTRSFCKLLCSLQTDFVTIGELSVGSFNTWDMWPLVAASASESSHWLTSSWDNKINESEQEYIVQRMRRSVPLNRRFKDEIDGKIAEAKRQIQSKNFVSWHHITC